MQLHLVFVSIEVIDGILDFIECFHWWHSEFCWKGVAQHLGCEGGFSLLYQGVHSVWGTLFNHLLHSAVFLLKTLKPLLPCPLFYSWPRVMQFFICDMSSEYCSVSLLRRSQLRSVPPGSAGLCFCFCNSGNVVVVLYPTRGDVMFFLGLSCLPWMLHMSGELF